MLVITNKRSCLKKYISCKGARFLLLDESGRTLELKAYLSGVGIEEIKRETLYSGLKDGFNNEFSAFLRKLNKENASLEWWAMDFTSKNSFMSRLYENIFHYICIQEAISGGRYDNSCLIIITDNYKLAQKLKLGAVRDACVHEIAVSGRFGFKGAIQQFSPFLIVFACLKTAARKILSNMILGAPRRAEEGALIITQFEDRSIGPDGLYRDMYLEGLRQYLSSKGFAPVTAGYTACNFFRFITGLKKKRGNKDIYPLDHFIPLRSIASSLALSLRRYYGPLKIGDAVEMRGYRLGFFIRGEIHSAVSSAEFFVNISAYFSFLALARAVGPKMLYYPFENRSWEKMLILAFREMSPQTKVIGYQHTVITPKHMHFLLEPGEYEEIPSPGKIITLGETTRRLLEDWHFPGNILHRGRALRQLASFEEEIPYKRQIRNILVALSADISEYVRVLLFLDEAFGGGQIHNIIMRPHPLIPFKKALKIYNPKSLRYSISRSTLKEDLRDCDAVCYASSGVSIEAVVAGKPVVCLEINNILNSDPLFDTDILKWRCRRPQDLTQVLNAIETVDRGTFRGIQKAALEYGRNYFSEAAVLEAAKDDLAVFLE